MFNQAASLFKAAKLIKSELLFQSPNANPDGVLSPGGRNGTRFLTSGTHTRVRGSGFQGSVLFPQHPQELPTNPPSCTQVPSRHGHGRHRSLPRLIALHAPPGMGVRSGMH